jgi:hypothetical protein
MPPKTVAVLLLLPWLSTCAGPVAPTMSVQGDWAAPVSGHSDFMYIRFEQDASGIRGTACEVNSGFVLFRDVPITVEYPYVSFVIRSTSTAPCCGNLAGASFAGAFDSTERLTGYLRYPSDSAGTARGIGFTRASASFIGSLCPAR